MAIDVQRSLDMGGARRILNLPDGVGSQEPATVAQLNAAVEGLAWKDSVRVASQVNVTLASPGATIDGIAMAANDRVLVRANSTASENGIYVWNGAAVAMTRAADMSTAAEVEQAVTTVEEGTDAGTSYRQTAVNVTLDSTTMTWTSFGTGAPAASETTPGISERATQVETDAGSDDTRHITPLKLASSVFAKRKFAAQFGDGSATSYVLTHNFNTYDVTVEIFRNSGNRDTVLAEVQRTSVNAVTIVADTAVGINAFRAVITA